MTVVHPNSTQLRIMQRLHKSTQRPGCASPLITLMRRHMIGPLSVRTNTIPARLKIYPNYRLLALATSHTALQPHQDQLTLNLGLFSRSSI
jgi:hypothetical protein